MKEDEILNWSNSLYHAKKVFIGLAILLFCSFKLNAQVFDFYRTEISVIYLPSYGSRSEVIEKVNNQISHKGVLTIWEHEKTKKRKLKPNYLIEDQIRQIDSLFKIKSFTFKINVDLVDSLKQSTFWKDTYNITDQDIDSFFTRKDTVTLDMNDIHISDVDLLSGVLDGIHIISGYVTSRLGRTLSTWRLKETFTTASVT